jgi:hypothetical protein
MLIINIFGRLSSMDKDEDDDSTNDDNGPVNETI